MYGNCTLKGAKMLVYDLTLCFVNTLITLLLAYELFFYNTMFS